MADGAGPREVTVVPPGRGGVRAARAERGLARGLGGAGRSGAFGFLLFEEGDALLDAGIGVELADALVDRPGDDGRGQFARGGQQPFAGLVELADHARAGLLVPVIALLLERSEEHTSELQSLMRISYAVFCLKKTHRQSAGCRSSEWT